MSFEHQGCMKRAEEDGKWLPMWLTCGTVIEDEGCMKKDEGKWAPFIEILEGIGSCPTDVASWNFCMKKTGAPEKWTPVIEFQGYDSLSEFLTHCCLTCGLCFPQYEAPRYIDVKFTGVQECPGGDLPITNGQIYTLEYRAGAPHCYWRYNVLGEIPFIEVFQRGFLVNGDVVYGIEGTGLISRRFFTVSFITDEGKKYPSCDSLSGIMTFDNALDDTCANKHGYGGSISIDWNIYDDVELP